MSDNFHHESRNGTDFTKRAFLGNGYFGIDISNNFGQGFGLSEANDPFPVLYLGGVYSNTADFGSKNLEWALFRALNMYGIVPLDYPTTDVFTSLGNLVQQIDYRKALVTTEGDWGSYHVKTEVFLCRHRPNIGVLRMECQSELNIHHDFFQLVQKDPRTRYEMLDLQEHGEVTTFNTTINEDKKQFQQGIPFQIVQASQIRIVSLQW